MDKITFLPEAELEDRRVYLLGSRNLRYGVWDAEKGVFYGIREKFGSRYVDYEVLWGDQTGTARAREATDYVVPDEIPLKDLLYLVCQGCEKRVEQIYEYDPDFKPNKGMKRTGDRHIYKADAKVCDREDGTYLAMWLSNKPLFDFMENVEAENPEAERRWM